MAIVYLAHLVVPLAVIAWLGFAPPRTKRLLFAKSLSVGLLLVGLWSAGIWFYPPGWARWIHAVLFIAAVRRASRAPVRARAGVVGGASAVGAAALAMLGIFGIWEGAAGRERPPHTFDLAPPLAAGRFCVISGGASPLLNFHMATLAPEYASFRGQSYGADFIAVGALGMRARSVAPQPRRLEAYHIYGTTVLAPCSGEVVSSHDGLPDRPIGSPDADNLPGNHVTLLCFGNEVLLAHMKPGSVLVSTGDAVTVGDPLGLVGNSGNSSEPHLHIHAQQPPIHAEHPLSGAPVNLSFEDRFLSRGDCL